MFEKQLYGTRLDVGKPLKVRVFYCIFTTDAHKILKIQIHTFDKSKQFY